MCVCTCDYCAGHHQKAQCHFQIKEASCDLRRRQNWNHAPYDQIVPWNHQSAWHQLPQVFCSRSIVTIFVSYAIETPSLSSTRHEALTFRKLSYQTVHKNWCFAMLEEWTGGIFFYARITIITRFANRIIVFSLKWKRGRMSEKWIATRNKACRQKNDDPSSSSHALQQPSFEISQKISLCENYRDTVCMTFTNKIWTCMSLYSDVLYFLCMPSHLEFARYRMRIYVFLVYFV